EKDGEEGRSNGGDPERQWRCSQLATHPAQALPAAAEAARKSARTSTDMLLPVSDRANAHRRC
ncbi:MAG: hypothetical protein WCC90_12450, partial [Methylocella sp.]